MEQKGITWNLSGTLMYSYHFVFILKYIWAREMITFVLYAWPQQFPESLSKHHEPQLWLAALTTEYHYVATIFNSHETARYGEIASAISNFFVCCMEMG